VTTAATAEPALVDVIVNSDESASNGATTRNNVVPHGRGASSASSPAAHAAHANTVAKRAGPTGQPRTASANASPAVAGSTIHTSRAHHNVIGVFMLVPLRFDE
jgi:hypothetical protein